MSPAATLEFWYDLASPYAYLSAMRIDALAHADGVTVVWRPFLLGPIFSAQGWPTSPFVVYPAKGRYMARDMERLAAARGLAFRLPQVFPARSITAARIAAFIPGESPPDVSTTSRFMKAFSFNCTQSETMKFFAEASHSSRPMLRTTQARSKWSTRRSIGSRHDEEEDPGQRKKIVTGAP